MRDEFSAYFLFAGLFSFCVLAVHYGGKVWNAIQDGRRRKKMQREAQEQVAKEAAQKEEKARQEAELQWRKEKEELDRQVRLFNRLSIQERKCLLKNYVGKEKNLYLDSGDPSTRKLWMQRYIIEIGFHSYCLSNKTCDLFDARYEELKAQVDEADTGN